MFHHLISSICLIALFSVNLAKQVKVEQREPWSDEAKKIKGIQLQTLCYRAPEILFGDVGFGPAVDLWSLGIMLCELGGFAFSHDTQKTTYSEVGLRTALFQQLGTPTKDELTKLNFFPSAPPKFSRKPWPRPLYELLGAVGLELVDGLLSWVAAARPTCAAVLDHGFLNPDRFSLGGVLSDGTLASATSFTGNRHDWNVLTGVLSPEVLRWLRSDAVFVPGSDENRALQIDFKAK